MKKLREKRPAVFLLLACYAACVVFAALLHLGQFIYNRVLYQNGTLAGATLSADDFTLLNMEAAEGGYVTLNDDPQMLLADTGRRVDTLRVTATYLHEPLVQTAYWAAPGQPYSVRRVAYAAQDGVFYLPAGGGQSLRLDSDAAIGNVVQFEEIVINEKRPFYRFFLPSATEAALLLAGPALLAAAFSVLREGIGAYKTRKGGAA